MANKESMVSYGRDDWDGAGTVTLLRRRSEEATGGLLDDSEDGI